MPDTNTRILLIDDDQVDRASVRRALAKSGLKHEITEAADGTAGLRLAEAQVFDCVLLDYRLPDVDTFELLADLLSPRCGGQAVMMLTGEADQDIALRLIRAGALDYLAKAEITPSSLARAIRYARIRRQILAELDAARREAETKSAALDTLNRQKTLLFSIIAHDLRNPFQALLGLTELLGRAVANQDFTAVERRAHGIRQAAGQAHALMESLFTWASAEMDTLAVVLSDVDLAEIVHGTVAEAAQAAADKEIALNVECDELSVRANPDMLSTVLRNLVSNAIKFTMPGGAITLAGHRLGDSVEISVSDTGVGMDADRLDDLFKLDRRTSTSGTAGERGSGLGLLLCRDLLDRQSSELDVRSVPGRGTTFCFTLSAGAPVESTATVA